MDKTLVRVLKRLDHLGKRLEIKGAKFAKKQNREEQDRQYLIQTNQNSVDDEHTSQDEVAQSERNNVAHLSGFDSTPHKNLFTEISSDLNAITDNQLIQSTRNAAQGLLDILASFSTLDSQGEPDNDSKQQSPTNSIGKTSPTHEKNIKQSDSPTNKNGAPKNAKLLNSHSKPQKSITTEINHVNTSENASAQSPNYRVTLVNEGKKLYWECSWTTKQGSKNLKKRFSCAQFGNEKAREMAINLLNRKMAPREYNRQGVVGEAKVQTPEFEQHQKNNNIDPNTKNREGISKNSLGRKTEPKGQVHIKRKYTRADPSQKKPKKWKPTGIIEQERPMGTKNETYNTHHPSEQTTSNSTTIQSAQNTVNGGVFLDKTDYTLSFMEMGRWIAAWVVNGRCLQRSFSVSQYGFECAKQLAENFYHSKIEAMVQSMNANKSNTNYEKHHNKVNKRPTTIHRGRGRPRKPTKEATTQASSIAQSDLRTDSKKNNTISSTKQHDIKNIFQDRVDNQREIYWEHETKSWCVLIPLSPQSTTLERISAQIFGYEKARQLAGQKLEDSEQHLLTQYYDGNEHGIAYERSRHCWRVTFWIESKQVRRNKYFNISKYGWEKAKNLAIIYKRRVEELGGEEPTDWGSGPKLSIQESSILRKILEKDHPYKMKYKPCSGMVNETPKKTIKPKDLNSHLISKANKVHDNQSAHLIKVKRPYKKRKNHKATSTTSTNALDTSEHIKMLQEDGPKIWKRTSDPDHPMSNVKGVHYSKREKAWICRWSDREAQKVKVHNFHINQHGFEGAKKKAEQLRLDKENQGLAKTRGNKRIPIMKFLPPKGNEEGAWEVYWTQDGISYSKSFKFNGPNADSAKEDALRYKAKLEELSPNVAISNDEYSIVKSEGSIYQTDTSSQVKSGDHNSNDFTNKRSSLISSDRDEDVTTFDQAFKFDKNFFDQDIETIDDSDQAQTETTPSSKMTSLHQGKSQYDKDLNHSLSFTRNSSSISTPDQSITNKGNFSCIKIP